MQSTGCAVRTTTLFHINIFNLVLLIFLIAFNKYRIVIILEFLILTSLDCHEEWVNNVLGGREFRSVFKENFFGNFQSHSTFVILPCCIIHFWCRQKDALLNTHDDSHFTTLQNCHYELLFWLFSKYLCNVFKMLSFLFFFYSGPLRDFNIRMIEIRQLIIPRIFWNDLKR